MIDIVTQTKMAKLACDAKKNSYSPYSKYRVGVCILSEDGELFTGCNVENASYGLTFCAEGSAIAKMASAGKRTVKAVAVVGTGDELCTPCGACRQMIREFAAPDTPIYLIDANSEKIVDTLTIEQLLPKSFGPNHLEKK
jgi:cytidine deaminase